MIEEAYVSFETAKLLKEKGFDNISLIMYKENGEVCINPKSVVSWRLKYWYPCLTLQMAMKWLREVHNIAINIGWGEIFEDKFQWWCIILNQKDGNILRESEYYSTYEEACEAAIKYCLENLI